MVYQPDRSKITPNIWVGAVPTDIPRLSSEGFTHLVLCAKEFQFPRQEFSGLQIKRCPLVDVDTGVVNNLEQAIGAAHWTANAAFQGDCVLVTCAAGVNRSALVAALALRLLGIEPETAVHMIRSKRASYCLSNDTFYRTVFELKI